MTLHRKAARGLDADMAWAKRELLDGRKVWCVRTRLGGLVVTLLSVPEHEEQFETWQTFDGHSLGDFTLTPVTLVCEEPRMGIEQDWPSTTVAAQMGPLN